jgi:hypothetical protein
MSRKTTEIDSAATARSHPSKRWLRALIAGLFLAISSLAFALFIATQWVENQILTADNWVSYASQLPKNPAVSKAIADVVTKQIYTNVPIEQKVKEALPPRAAFLAGPLSDQLQTRTVSLVQKVESSDTFNNLWTGANRLAITRFLTNARSNKSPVSAKVHDKFNVDISSIKPVLQKRLGDQASISPALQQKSQQALSITADLQAKRERLWQAVRTIDFIHAILPAVFLVSFLGMLVFASRRRRAFIILAGITIVLVLAELIAIKYGRQQIIDQVQNKPYIPAVSHIFDSLIVTLKDSLFWALGLLAAAIIICILAGPARWAERLRQLLRLDRLTAKRPAQYWSAVRGFAAVYRSALWGALAAFALLYLAFGSSTSVSGLVNCVLLAVSGIFLVQLLADKRVTAVTAASSKHQ